MGDDVFRPSDEIELTGKGDYAVLRITREAKRNAMNRSARDGMQAAFEHAKDRFRVIVLTGTGRSFCAGIDLKERGEDVERGIHSASQEWAEVNVAIRQHPSVFIAAVNGTALGGGLRSSMSAISPSRPTMWKWACPSSDSVATQACPDRRHRS